MPSSYLFLENLIQSFSRFPNRLKIPSLATADLTEGDMSGVGQSDDLFLGVKNFDTAQCLYSLKKKKNSVTRVIGNGP